MDLNSNRRFKQELDKFNRATELFHQALVAYNQQPQDQNLQLAVSHAFMLLVELSWKVMAHIIKSNGEVDNYSPKNIIVKAQEQGIIQSAENWIEALQNRNRVVHIYDQESTNLVLEFAQQKFPGMIHDLATKFKLNLEAGELENHESNN